MSAYEYRTVAAPRRAPKAQGVKGVEARLARAMGEIITAEAANGWEYLRADSLPVEEGGGLFSKARTEWRAVLVFRRERRAAQREAEPAFAPEPRAPGAPREPFMSVAAASNARPDPAPGVPGEKRS